MIIGSRAVSSGLGVSLSRFSKIRHIVQDEVEQAGLGWKTLGTNQMRKEEKIRMTLQKHVKCNNAKWTQEAFLRLIHIEKGNVARRKSAKKHVDGKDDSTTMQTKQQAKPSRRRTRDAEMADPGRSPATSRAAISTTDGHEQKSPKKHVW